MSKTSAAVKNKYNNKTYDRIQLVVPKGQKDEIKSHAQAKGESLNKFINRAIDETIERDNAAGAIDSAEIIKEDGKP